MNQLIGPSFVAAESLYRIAQAFTGIRTKRSSQPNYGKGWRHVSFDWTGGTHSLQEFERIPAVMWKKLASRAKRLHLARFSELPIDLLGASAARMTDPKTGISVRVIEQYDVTINDVRWRVDMAGYPRHQNS